MTINVAIVDDKLLNRSSIVQKLSSYSEINIVFEAVNGQDYLDKLRALTNHPHLVFMDIDMPVMDGIEAIKRASLISAKIKYIVLTVFEDTERIFEAIKAGANGYLLKEDKAIHIFDAIYQVINFNGIPMSPVIARRAMELMLKTPMEKLQQTTPGKDLGLTPRELEILKELASGATYNAIGEKLFVSPLTVRKHVGNIYDKLHVSTRMQIVSIAQKNNLL